ncbi:MAG: SDR family NAD(P)-dependent oxidoreductase [Deltaproteobacteria bacterium]|nr:SDR family NAD(P)-dependent oxidoreductase [Deltaproteobacteria bacterium]
MKNIKGLNAIVTGGSRGLGPIIAEALAKEGVNLVLAARSKEELTIVAKDLSVHGTRTVAVPVDITDADSLKKLVEQAHRELGSIEILINNAGIEWVCSYIKLSLEYIRRIIDTNLRGPLLLTRLLLPHMLERGKGHVVTMSSLGGQKGSPYSATYAATKAGLIEWTSGLREELRGTGVSASVVCPGFVSEKGMFAVYNKRAPAMTGETTPDKVAKAVIHAIREDKQEIIVNPGPVLIMKLCEAIHPAIMTTILRLSGVYEFYRKQAAENEAAENEASEGELDSGLRIRD